MEERHKNEFLKTCVARHNKDSGSSNSVAARKAI